MRTDLVPHSRQSQIFSHAELRCLRMGGESLKPPAFQEHKDIFAGAGRVNPIDAGVEKKL